MFMPGNKPDYSRYITYRLLIIHNTFLITVYLKKFLIISETQATSGRGLRDVSLLTWIDVKLLSLILKMIFKRKFMENKIYLREISDNELHFFIYFLRRFCCWTFSRLNYSSYEKVREKRFRDNEPWTKKRLFSRIFLFLIPWKK